MEYERIRNAFPKQAWAYAVQDHNVQIGKWNGKDFAFHNGWHEKYLLELRVFNHERELRFIKGKRPRDTEEYKNRNFEIVELLYVLYGSGEKKPDGLSACEDGYTVLSEARSGKLYFPAKLTFDDRVEVKLLIRNFIAYNDIPVRGRGEPYDSELNAGATAVSQLIDYAYAGFYVNGKREAP